MLVSVVESAMENIPDSSYMPKTQWVVQLSKSVNFRALSANKVFPNNLNLP